MNRRDFLNLTASGLTVTFLAGCALPVIPKRPKPVPADGLSWIRFDGARYTLSMPRVEMGQNIATAMKQVACEELGIAWTALDVQLHTTQSIQRVRATVGSESVKDFMLPLAQACATLREAVLKGATTGLIEAREFAPAELRAFKRNGAMVGKSQALVHAHEIVTGQPLYASDVRRKGMLYGRVLRAPITPERESAIQSLDEVAARAVPGFVQIVRDPLLRQMNSEGVGIVAKTPGALDRIEAALKLRWQMQGDAFADADIARLVDVDARLANDSSLSNKVHNDRVSSTEAWDVNIKIDIPLAAHAPIEPRVAVAEFSAANKLDVWVGSQDVFYQRDVLVKRLGLNVENVAVHGQRVGGAFGGKTICTVELEAAVLARAVNAPVKVQWTRAQEFQFGFHRPPSSHRMRARVKDGRIVDWWHAFASSHILFTNAVLPPWMQRITHFIGDDGVARGSTLPYRAQKKRTEFDLVRLPIFTGPWRGLGAGPNVFAVESAIDECARVAKVDPLTFRLTNVEDRRLARVLMRVGEAARWRDTRTASDARIKRGRGIACGIYKAMSYAAVVADVEIDTIERKVRVRKLWCAHDCGLVVNPDQVRAQCEGNLVWGLGMVLTERLPIAESRVAAFSFADSPIPKYADVPAMEIVLVDEGEAPSGAGETAIVAAGAAIANAIRDATGVRIQRLPIRYGDLLKNTA
jgi:isoquinoline 1-oxidoreductase subunit beta